MFLISFMSIVMVVPTFAKMNVAIIGGGIGGASSAYFLNERKPNEFNIDLYEANRIGGRLATVEYNGHFYEIGGSIIHSKNLFMKQFIEKFGLQVRKSCSGDFGIFNGTDMLFKTSQYDLVTVFNLMWRYGFDIFRLDTYISQMVKSFQRIYDMLENTTYAFNTTDDLINHVNHGLTESLNMSTYDGFVKNDFSERFIQELVASIVRCNYCQALNVHHFVGSVAVAGSGSNLWSVEGGNWQVVQHLIAASGATFINDEVISISAVENTSNINVSTNSKNKLYDYVVVATPLTDNSNIAFHGFKSETNLKDEYHVTVCTLVKGKLSEHFFNTHGKTLPNNLFFTDKFYLNVLAKINPVDGNCQPENQVWKIFSDRELTDSLMKQIFDNYSIISIKNWLAYPEYKSTALNKAFYLFNNVPNLFHVNAIESLASAMEMSAIGGHNVASLIIQSYENLNNPNSAVHVSTQPPHEEL